MKHVSRAEIVDFVTYGERRDALRAEVLREKAKRRVHVGPYLTFLFENALTIRYQIQEMVRTERMVREADILHELETYNELLGGPNELGCTLLVEIEDQSERERLLPRWIDLPEHLYVSFEDGARARALIDERQRSRGRLSTVQYLKFRTAGRVPIAIGSDHPDMVCETTFDPVQRAALRADLAE